MVGKELLKALNDGCIKDCHKCLLKTDSNKCLLKFKEKWQQWADKQHEELYVHMDNLEKELNEQV